MKKKCTVIAMFVSSFGGCALAKMVSGENKNKVMRKKLSMKRFIRHHPLRQ